MSKFDELIEFALWLSEHDRELSEKVWDEGAIAGHRAAVLHAPLAPNPYREAVDE